MINVNGKTMVLKPWFLYVYFKRLSKEPHLLRSATQEPRGSL
jgi:hypothetical protein